jgi:hypothetical protein
MPKNRFPDSLPKRELRRRVARRISAFREAKNLPLRLSYCGMPSVEFLDVQVWQDSLRSVCAVEIDSEILSDMRVQWDSLALGLPIHFVNADVLEFLYSTNDCYDLYNLDFFGGLINPTSTGKSRCVEAIRNLIHRQSTRSHSFILVVTFNVRDRGVAEYLAFIDDVPKVLAGWQNIENCCATHKKNQATRLKLCFPYLCWHLAVSNNFAVWFSAPFVYHSSATMIHFYAEFTFQERALPDLTSYEVLAELISMPLLRLYGMIPQVELAPLRVERPE